MTTRPVNGVPNPMPPHVARRAVSLDCTLARGAGSPIRARTIDLGSTGMRIATERPLALDETVSFDLLCGDVRIRGHARVVCQERPDIYGVRFEALQPATARSLQELTTSH
jgi:hypothetical protein